MAEFFLSRKTSRKKMLKTNVEEKNYKNNNLSYNLKGAMKRQKDFRGLLYPFGLLLPGFMVYDGVLPPCPYR